MKKPVYFSATICKIGINPVVDPPAHVLSAVFVQARRSTGPIPVHATINGAEFSQTLVKFRGAWRLYVNGGMLKACGLKVGDEAKIKIEFDPRPRDVPVPKLFAAALKGDVDAKRAFEKLSPSRQKEILKYLSALKTKESLGRNVEKVLRQLSGESQNSPHIAMRRK